MTTLTGPITACFYSGNENNPACKQLGGTCIRMTGKRASPKVRSCCSWFGVLLVLSCLLVRGRCKWIAADEGGSKPCHGCCRFLYGGKRTGVHADGTLTDIVCRMQGYDHGSVGSIPWSLCCGDNLSEPARMYD